MPRILDGTTWLELAAAARRHGVSEDAVKMAVRRGKVRSHRLDGKVWVCSDDVADVELANYRRRVEDTPTATLRGMSDVP